MRLLIPAVLVLLIRALDASRPVDWLFILCGDVLSGLGQRPAPVQPLLVVRQHLHIKLPDSLAAILYIGFSGLDVVLDPRQRGRGTTGVGWRSSPPAWA